MKKIWIANDHGGYGLKLKFLNYFEEKGLDYCDVGCHSTDIVRYPYYAADVAHAVSLGEATKGILICSTGIGMSIFANKYKSVRAALCTDSFQAKMTRSHNDSNILCLGGMITGEMAALEILDVWLNTEYMGGRHDISLGLIKEAEEYLCASEEWVHSGPKL